MVYAYRRYDFPRFISAILPLSFKFPLLSLVANLKFGILNY